VIAGSREDALPTDTVVTARDKPRGGAFSGGLAFGPGLVFFLAAVGAQDLVSNAAAGANYGYSLLWSLVLLAVARYVILEASGRYVLVTGETILAGYARAGRWVTWLLFVFIILKRHLANLYHLLFLGVAAHLLAPLPTPHSQTVWSLVFWIIGFALMYWGRYGAIEKCAKPMALVLGGALLVVAAVARPDVGEAARGLVIPSLPQGQGFYSFFLILMALTGAGAGSVNNLKYAAFVREKGWLGPADLGKHRRNVVLSVVAILVMAALVQVVAATTLQPAGIVLRSAEDLALMFSQTLGQAGKTAFALGLWAAVFTTYLGANTGYSLMISDIYHNVLRPRRSAGEEPAGAVSPGHQPAYRWSLIWFCVSPLYVLLTNWKPVWLALISAAAQVLLLPVVVLVLMRLTNDTKLMGSYTNGWLVNLVMAVVALASIYLTYQNVMEMVIPLLGAS